MKATLWFLLLSATFCYQTIVAVNFIQCVSLKIGNKTSLSLSGVVHTQTDISYSSVLDFSINNLVFTTLSTPKPIYIITPKHPFHIQATIICSKLYNLQIRIRSGGHDFEGLSYVSNVPFIVLDLINLRSIAIDKKTNTAWVEAGASLGELYYATANTSETLAFSAGICPTVGVGGHLSGGGIGMLSRKYGMATDQVVDAKLIDVNGRILDRKSMGEDLFWAIRGGGGNNFGVVLSWKVNLVPIPAKVTVFQISKTLEQNLTKLVHRWQEIASELTEEMLLAANISHSINGTFQVSFQAMYLGNIANLIPMMDEKFPELGIRKEECLELKWIDTVGLFARYPLGTNPEVLLDRTQNTAISYKSKSDFVTESIPESALEGIWERWADDEAKLGYFMFAPGGGKLSEISESATPYPHRAGNLYSIQYVIQWTEQGTKVSEDHINWMRDLYSYMKPYVSKNPRSAYVNFRDLDIGTNVNGKYTTYEQAKVWGRKYFKDNFDRLVKVKTKIDPTNFFWHEQSIPTLTSQ